MLMTSIRVKQAGADADTLVVSTALSGAELGQKPVILVGRDTNLLVVLVARVISSAQVYMLCHRNPVTVFNIHDIQQGIGATKQHLRMRHGVYHLPPGEAKGFHYAAQEWALQLSRHFQKQ